MSVREALRPFQVMAKPIGPRCNLHCTYCYYLEKERLYPDTQRFEMPDVVLEAYIRDFIASQAALGLTEIDFNWQGGEPTILGVAFFRRVVTLQHRYAPAGVAIRNALQTNGTLLDAEWMSFLEEHEFLVGLSIDGPAEEHDRYRRDRAGRESHARVMAALELLARHHVEFNTLTALHRHNTRDPAGTYRFLRDAGSRYLQFIPIVERSGEGGALAAPPQIDHDGAAYAVTPWSVLPRAYGEFLCGMFDTWIGADVGQVFVQFFDVQLGQWLGVPGTLCWYAETCGTDLALEHNGDLYACDHYVYPAYRLGNVLQTPVGSLANSSKQIRFGTDKRDTQPRQCRECTWRFACNGGCPKHRFLSAADGEPGLSYFCTAHRRFFEHAGPTLQAMAALVQSGRPAADIMSGFGLPGTGATLRRNDPCPCGSGRKYKLCCAQRSGGGH